MRKLLTILFLFAACALKAQYTPNSGAYSYKGLMPLKSLQLPTDCGYPVTAIHAPDSSRSAIYFDSCNALLYRFDPKPKTWSVILDSVGAGSVVTLQLAYDGSIAAGDNPLINGGGQGRTFNIDSVNFIDLRALPSGDNGYAAAQIMSRSPEALNKVGVVGTAYQHIGGDTIIQAFIGSINEPTQVGNVIYLYDTTAYLLQRFSTTESIEQKFSHPPPIEDNVYYIPLTVNGNPADSEGNIVVNVVSGIDSLFITNTDSIFIISGGDTIFVGINDDGCTNGIKQPGYVTWSGDGLTFDVTSGFFTLDCTLYDGNAGSITLDPADPTFPRFDVIGWDTTGAVIKVTGTAGMNPAIPQVDPSYQIGLTVINIPAGATVPGGITQDVIYDENNEDWTGAVSGITVDLDNTTNPYHLTKSADAGTWSPAPKTLTFTNDTGYIDANDYGILKLFISLKESIAAVGNIRVSFLNDGDAVSNIVSLGGGVGFNKSIADTYQNISVPLSSFIFTSTVFNQIRITFAGTGDGAYIDYIQLQGGITPPSIAGVYQDTTYSRNDSLFGRKNNTEFFIQHLTLARLPQLWGIYINNDDSTYDPYGVDVGIGVDTALLKDWIINTVIDNDTTITTVLDDLDYVVDTISNDPPVGVAEGYKVLVGTSPTDDFAGHENEIATLVGSVWTFEVPAANETLEVHNSTQLLFYKYTGVDWILQAVPALIGGNTGLVEPDIGTTDANSFTIKTDNIDAIVIDTLQDVFLPKFLNAYPNNYLKIDSATGRVDTSRFNVIAEGTNVNFTYGGDTTYVNATGGGTPSLTETQIAYGDGSNLMTSDANFIRQGDSVFIIQENLTTTLSTGLSIRNSTASTSGVPVQNSPSLRLRGNAWNLGGSGNDATAYWDIYTVPQSTFYDPDEPNARGTLTFKPNALPTPVMTLSYNGNLSTTHVTAAGQVQGDYGAFNTVIGAQQLLGGLAYPSSQQTYRTTDGGSDLTPQLYISSVSNGDGNPAFSFDRSSGLGLGFLARNDQTPTTRPIMRANIFVTDLTNTAGSEAGGLGFGTQTGGAVAAERMRITSSGNLLINTTTDVPSSKLTVESTTQGFLPPRMTATQASAISSPAEGLLVYVTDTNGTFTAKGWWGWDGAAWQKLNN